MVYIAEGYPRPVFTIGKEEYKWVKKGIMAQRALPYTEINSDCILMLDDDVLLGPDSVERLLYALEEYDADAVGADAFKNHQMSFGSKVYAAITNLVFPHWSRNWAFKVHRNGSFSYNNNPSKSFYWSQSCAGTAILFRKEAFCRFHMEEELWLESLGFPYGADQIDSYKFYINGYRLGILYDSNVIHLDARSASAVFQKSEEYHFVRTRAMYMNWYRSIYRNGKDTPVSRFIAATVFGLKMTWLMLIMCGASIIKWDRRFIVAYLKGLREGHKAVRSPEFKNLPPFCFIEK